MPWWKKSSVSSWSAAVKWIRLGSPVVPEVGRVTMRSTSPAGTQSMRMPCVRTSSPDVSGSRARSSRDLSSPGPKPASRSA